MRVKWLELALDDLDAAVEYIAKENPQAARRVESEFGNQETC